MRDICTYTYIEFLLSLQCHCNNDTVLYYNLQRSVKITEMAPRWHRDGALMDEVWSLVLVQMTDRIVTGIGKKWMTENICLKPVSSFSANVYEINIIRYVKRLLCLDNYIKIALQHCVNVTLNNICKSYDTKS